MTSSHASIAATEWTPLPFAWARAQRIVASRLDDGQISISTSPKTPGWALSEVMRRYPQAHLQNTTETQVEALLASTYAREGDVASVVGAAENDLDLDRLMQDIPEVTDLLDATDGAPVIKMINALLTQAARDGASDIHFEVFETHASVRYRVDGQFREVVAPRKALHAALISRIKIMAHLDIAEKRLPQDGRIGLRVGGKAIDVRVSTVPTAHGERVVLRLLLKDAGRLQLASLGMAPEVQEGLTKLIRQPHGIVLVTGPTGSGKTTTLYSALGQLDKSTNNIMTVEDPIEYDLPGIAQIPVNAKIGMSFAVALRAVLRQDPDNILIGETRDLETAQIAIQSSLTGHGVLTSVHTNNAVSAVTRVVDMGVEPFLLASTLLGVLAQRLVRCLCTDCKQPEQSPDGRQLYRAVGCPACAQSGYRGRTGVHELFVINNDLRRLINQQADEQTLLAAALEGGMRTMREDGQRWVDAGITTQEEILRVTRDA
ncbi:type II secretion system ATPase GspE [Paenalcaligenes niemegkensis]|uniref:type II secretion system ATPase GspE n=1 Tax=Paenalcaligenes niemegkensis TaxID=2895469 RepID=UPI001EE84C18|nr:type II secretion system ATPase GspE [Paenalcaligenes niemegkensis]MCQ9617058.1 type II secretion system ATPase GspE [Paenalcaligenes niemegkensis]